MRFGPPRLKPGAKGHALKSAYEGLDEAGGELKTSAEAGWEEARSEERSLLPGRTRQTFVAL